MQKTLIGIFINLNFGAMKKIGIILLLMMVTLVSCNKDDDENDSCQTFLACQNETVWENVPSYIHRRFS